MSFHTAGSSVDMRILNNRLCRMYSPLNLYRCCIPYPMYTTNAVRGTDAHTGSGATVDVHWAANYGLRNASGVWRQSGRRAGVDGEAIRWQNIIFIIKYLCVYLNGVYAHHSLSCSCSCLKMNYYIFASFQMPI